MITMTSHIHVKRVIKNAGKLKKNIAILIIVKIKISIRKFIT